MTGSTGMVRVIAVPGLAVHAYAELPVQRLRDNGYDARLLQPWRGAVSGMVRQAKAVGLISCDLSPQSSHGGVRSILR